MALLYVALQIDSTEFIHCKELVDQHLQYFQPSNTVYIFKSGSQSIQTHLDERLPEQINLQARRNQAVPAIFIPLQASSHEDDMETDEFYDGFKYLYNEDGTPEAGQSSRGHLRQKESSGFCPPLEPVPEID